MSEQSKSALSSLYRARLKRASARLAASVEAQLDDCLKGADTADDVRAGLLLFTIELAGALCSVVDHADDRTQGLTSPGILRDFLRTVATDLAEQAKDRDEHEPIGAKVLASTVEQLRSCADGLDACQKAVADLMASALAAGVKP